jgi:DNA-directed RNA polymerase subunit M/transcription elongation factor TFIIS
MRRVRSGIGEMSQYAYEVPDSYRENLVPNLRLAAEQPWMGLTAYISNKPHLVIAKDGEDFIMEDEFGRITRVDYVFDWDEPKQEINRLVAASRTSHLKSAGLLAYDPDLGEWAIRVGTSNMRYPIEAAVEELEDHNWQVTSVISPDDDFLGKEPGDKDPDVTIEARAACPHCHSDQHLQSMEDEDLEDHSGKEKMYACHNCGKWSFEHELEVSDHDKDQNKNNNDVDYDEDSNGPDRHQAEPPRKPKQSAVPSAFSFQGNPVVTVAGKRIGVAVKPGEQSNEDILQTVHELPTAKDQEQDYVRQRYRDLGLGDRPYTFDNPFINRGGGVRHGDFPSLPKTSPTYPQEFSGGTYILVAKWLTPEHTVMFENPEGTGVDPRFKGIITMLGGPGSHAVVVAGGNSMPCIIASGDDIDRIQPGDHVSIDGESGVVHVNGGDPSFVAQDPSLITSDNPIYRFVYANGHGYVEEMVPGQMVGDKGGHGGMLASLMDSGHVQMSDDFMSHNAALGYICDNGTVIQDKNNIQDQKLFEDWIHQQEQTLGLPEGPIKQVDVAAYLPGEGLAATSKLAAVFTMEYPGGQGIHNGTSGAFAHAGIHATVTAPGLPKPIDLPFTAPNMFVMVKMFQAQGLLAAGTEITVDSDNPALAKQLIVEQSGVTASRIAADSEDYYESSRDEGHGNKLRKAIKCPECDSHTIEAQHKDEEKGTAEFLCLHCGNTWKSDYRKHATGDKDGIVDPPKGPSGSYPAGQRVQMTRPEMKGLRGSIVEHHSEDPIFPGSHYYNVLLDDGRTLKGIHQTTFDKIKSASFDKGGVGGYGYATYPEDPTAQSQIQYVMRQIVDARSRGDENSVRTLQQQLEQLLTSQVGQNMPGATTPPVNVTSSNEDVFSDDDPPAWFIEELDSDLREALYASMQKGAPYPENSYKNAPDHTPKKQKKDWPAEVNSIYNACMREGNGRGDSDEDKKSSCAAIAWAQYKKTVKNKGKGNTKPDKESSFQKQSFIEEIASFLSKLIDSVSNIKASGAMDKLLDAAVNPANPLSYVDDFAAAAAGGMHSLQSGDKVGSIRDILPLIVQSIVTGITHPVVASYHQQRFASRTKPLNDGQGINEPWLGKGYEGHPVMCYMCGNQRSASLGTRCEHCGYVLSVRRDSPPKNEAAFLKSSALQRGEWYTMSSPDYKVPDVIQVIDVDDQEVTAAIEGDDKGLFPITLKHEEIEREGYLFEPYSSREVMGRTGNYFLETQDEGLSGRKEARRSFTVKEQQELIEENPGGRARNIHKLDLEGTHYPDVKMSKDPFKFVEENPFWLW